ncbi:MAG: hypothetical protein KatS3mg121_1551 [Gammaproteobacteria bacterium]|nr:MAG: hypothetical protein KatS3mg121_1551 [Gammaproteobacteria bacterium]
MRTVSRGGGLSKAALTLTVLALWATAPALADIPRAPHGAADMDYQKQRLAELRGGADPTALPAFVDRRMWAYLVPDDNALNAERIALGQALYFDTRLSRDGSVACATCHDVTRGFTDRRPVSEGIDGALGRRNAPTTLNAAFFNTQFWDGRAPSLEEQAKLPVTNPIEMGHPSLDAAIAAIADDPEYRRLFQAAYGRAPNAEDMARAIAAFERTLLFLDAPFDRYLAGDETAISEQAKRGWALFNGKARCVSCHMINSANPIGTDNRFHNIGVSARHQDFDEMVASALEALRDAGLEAVDKLALETDLSELGRFLVTKNPADIGAFKTQQLRNIGITAPYMHDGSMQTLWDVVDHYNRGGEANPFLSGGIEPLNLTESEIDDLVAFLFTLTDVRFAEENRRALEAQMTLAAERRPFRQRELAERRLLPFETLVQEDAR